MRTYEGTVVAAAPDKIRVQAKGGIITVRRDDLVRWERKRCVGPCDFILILGFDVVDARDDGSWSLQTTREIVGLQVQVSWESGDVSVYEKKPTSQRAAGICAALPQHDPSGTC